MTLAQRRQAKRDEMAARHAALMAKQEDAAARKYQHERELERRRREKLAAIRAKEEHVAGIESKREELRKSMVDMKKSMLMMQSEIKSKMEKDMRKLAMSSATVPAPAPAFKPRPSSAGPKRPSSAPRRRPSPAAASVRRSADDLSLARKRQLETMIAQEQAREGERSSMLASVGDARERARLTKCAACSPPHAAARPARNAGGSPLPPPCTRHRLFALERSRARAAMDAFA